MKRQNLIILIMVAIISAILAIIISNTLFGTPQSKPIKVPVVDKISSSFPDVNNDSKYKSVFNAQALDPTQLIQIGGSNNSAPFQGGASQ